MSNEDSDVKARNLCASCKFQRRKCDKKCVLYTYFPVCQNGVFDAAHKVFGVCNMNKMISKHSDERDRLRVAESIKWEARIWREDPVDGPLGSYRRLEEQNRHLRDHINQMYQLLQSLGYEPCAMPLHENTTIDVAKGVGSSSTRDHLDGSVHDTRFTGEPADVYHGFRGNDMSQERAQDQAITTSLRHSHLSQAPRYFPLSVQQASEQDQQRALMVSQYNSLLHPVDYSQTGRFNGQDLAFVNPHLREAQTQQIPSQGCTNFAHPVPNGSRTRDYTNRVNNNVPRFQAGGQIDQNTPTFEQQQQLLNNGQSYIQDSGQQWSQTLTFPTR